MMYCTLLALFLNPIPLISGTVQSEMPDIPDRAGEITIDELLIFAESGNGVYSNGYWEVPLNFTLAQGIMNVNITVNVTHDAVFEANTTERGNLTAGAYNTSLEGLNCTGVFNFTDEGLYSVNASVEGWLNGTGMVAGYKQLTDLNFSTITDYLVNISLQGLQKGGVYGARVPVNVSCYVNYTGNGFADETNVSLSIVNVSSGLPEAMISPGTWQFVPMPLGMGDGFGPLNFTWIPSVGGPGSFYDITVTATDNMTGGSNSTTERVKVQNITEPHLKRVGSSPAVVAEELFSISVWLNNTGNSIARGDVHLSIYENGHPENVVLNVTETSGEIPPRGLNDLMDPEMEMLFEDLHVDLPGRYVIDAELLGTGENGSTMLTVEPVQNRNPVLDNESILLTPDPTMETITEGTLITFRVNYSDIDGDEGSVTLFLDGEPLTMTNGSANWTDGTVFSYEWVSTSGPHTYYFYAEDLPGLSFILDNDTNVFEFIIHERMNGVIRGNVRDSARSNVSGAELVIYNTSLSAKNVIVVDRYFNTTTDQNGDYSLELPFCDYKFVIKMNEDWLDDNNYSGAKPSIGNFLIDMTHQEAWMNFTLDRTPVPTRTTVAGIINHSAGNLEEVNIIVEIYADEEGEMDVLMDDVVITVDITWRTWMNLTTRTDENGSYSIAKIPTEAPPLDEEKVTGRKTFRHDQGIPVSSENGWWYVIANRSGHHDEKQLLEFHYGKTTWWNTTLRKIISEPEQFYQITGTLSPPDAAISFSGTQTVEHDTETGEFTISYLTDGLYKLTFSKEGYIRQFRNITVAGSGWELDITLLLEDTDEPKVYQEVIGPFLDGNGDGISGILVSFQLDGILYEETTGTGGKAIFEVHKPLPEETPITAKFEGKERTWNWGDKEPYDAFAEPKGGGESSFMIVLIIVIVVIFGIVVAVLLISRSRGAVEEEEEEMDTGYECPECGTSVSPEMSACPECGQSFDEEEYKCPECGEPVEADATGCGGCGVEFGGDEEEEEEVDDAEGLEENGVAEDLDVEEEEEEEIEEYKEGEHEEEMEYEEEDYEETEEEEEFECPECGAGVKGDAERCGGCGVEFDTG